VKPGGRLAAHLLAACLLCGCIEKEPIRIGYIGELTGNTADTAEAARNGVLQAVDQINQAGGINGHRVELIARDTGDTENNARQAATELLQNKVIAVIGPTTTKMVSAVLPIYETARVPLISPTASAVELTGHDDYLFRINLSLRDKVQIYADICLNRGLRRISSVINQNNLGYTGSWFSEFKRAFERGGGQIVAAPGFDSNAASLAAQIDLMLDPRPDALLLIANASDTARLAQQARKASPAIPLIGIEWAATEQLIELGGKAVDGMTILQQYDADDKSPRYLSFHQKYVTRFGRNPAFASILAHDAATTLFETLARRSPGMSIKEGMMTLGPFQGLQEPIQFDSYGDAQRHVYRAVIDHGRFVRTP
jgi:branched-chain amino acid transport system substrate-binding protein